MLEKLEIQYLSLILQLGTFQKKSLGGKISFSEPHAPKVSEFV